MMEAQELKVWHCKKCSQPIGFVTSNQYGVTFDRGRKWEIGTLPARRSCRWCGEENEKGPPDDDGP